MEDDLPQRVPGADLKARREHLGILQAALCKELGISRTKLHRWEKDPRLDPISAAHYERALQSILAKALGEVGMNRKGTAA